MRAKPFSGSPSFLSLQHKYQIGLHEPRMISVQVNIYGAFPTPLAFATTRISPGGFINCIMKINRICHERYRTMFAQSQVMDHVYNALTLNANVYLIQITFFKKIIYIQVQKYEMVNVKIHIQNKRGPKMGENRTCFASYSIRRPPAAFGPPAAV